ncbi:MAG: hypothetical protein WAM14_21765 [Candidatus Nitrosopolaris sp.]
MKCTHIFVVEISFALHKEVEVARIAPLTTTTTCIYCDSSNIVKDGLRHNKYGDIQKYDCRNCNHYFTPTTLSTIQIPVKYDLNAKCPLIR